jgi:hypothetical protein
VKNVQMPSAMTVKRIFRESSKPEVVPDPNGNRASRRAAKKKYKKARGA